MQTSNSKKEIRTINISFKKNEEIPIDWITTNIQNVTESFHSGTWGEDCTKKELCHPVIRSTEINHDDGQVNLSTVEYRTIPKKQLEKYLLRSGDILIVSSSGSEHLIGRSALFEQSDDRKYFFSNFMLRLRSQNIDAKFLHFFLQSHSYFNFLKKMQQTTSGLRNFPKNDFLSLKLPLPPLQEQKQIVRILSTIDETLNKTSQIIEQTQLLKQGLMQKLLTKGISQTKFKKVEWFFGKEIEIPENWEILSIHDTNIKIIDGDRGNEYPKENDFSKSDYCLFLSTKNVTKDGFLFDECSFVSKKKDEQLRKGRLTRGDIVITTRGTVGNIAYFDESIPYDVVRINSGMAILRNNDEFILQKFFYHLLKSTLIVKQLKLLTSGSAQPQITIAIINSLKIIVPSVDEQQKIVMILSNMDAQIFKEKRYKSNLKLLKKGLIQKLLIGQIRVKPIK